MLRLMIVDDEKTTRESLAKYIPWHTLNIGPVRTARNGIEALALAAQEPPEILLTDVRMPKMDGLELADRIQSLYPRCKVVFLSGYADKEYLLKAIRLQAVSYVEKPVVAAEVKEAVRRAASALERDQGQQREVDQLKRTCREAVSMAHEEVIRRLVTEGGASHERVPGEAFPSFEADTCFTVAAMELCWSDGGAETEKAALRREVLASCAAVSPFDTPASLLGFAEVDILAIIAAKKITASHPGYRAACSALLAAADRNVPRRVHRGDRNRKARHRAGSAAGCLRFGSRVSSASILPGVGQGAVPGHQGRGQVFSGSRKISSGFARVSATGTRTAPSSFSGISPLPPDDRRPGISIPFGMSFSSSPWSWSSAPLTEGRQGCSQTMRRATSGRTSGRKRPSQSSPDQSSSGCAQFSAGPAT